MERLSTLVLASIFAISANAQWQHISSPVNANLYGIAVNDSGKGVIAGLQSNILNSTDNGETWNDSMYDAGSLLQNRAVAFSNLNTVFVGSEIGKLYRSDNAGFGFQGETPIPSFSNVKALRFINNTIGFAIDDNCNIAKTSNGGGSWQTYFTDPCGDAGELRDITSASGNIIYIVGDNSHAIKINLNDSTATLLSAINSGNHHSVYFLTDSIGFVGGVYNSSTKVGYLKKTIDGGASFTDISDSVNSAVGTVTQRTLRAMYWVDVDTGYISIDNKLLKTTNGGNKWMVEDSASNTWTRIAKGKDRLIAIGLGGQIAYRELPKKPIEDTTTTNIRDIVASTWVHIYPNPAERYIEIEGLDSDHKVDIFNNLGQRVITANINRQLDVTHLSKGFYTGIVQTRSGNKQFHFVKQ